MWAWYTNIDCAIQLKEVCIRCWINKTAFAQILVIISALCMCYKVWNDGFTLWSLLDLRTFKAFPSSYSSPVLNHLFDFWLAEKYSEPSWKSGLAKTGPSGQVPPPLCHKTTFSSFACVFQGTIFDDILLNILKSYAWFWSVICLESGEVSCIYCMAPNFHRRKFSYKNL